MTKNPPNYVIESAKELPFMLRLRDIILTILVWILYFYFMQDFFYFLRDVFVWASNGFTDAGSYSSFTSAFIFVDYLKIIIVLSAVFIGWSLYNFARFRNKKRRRTSLPVTVEQMAAKANVDPEELEGWQRARILVVHHDERGRLTDVVKQ